MKEAKFTEIADFIRTRSRAEELVSSSDLEALFGAAFSESPERPQCFIQDVMLIHQDIKVFPDNAGNRFYYSELFMTDAYVAVLALKSEGNLRMMVEIIRENSRTYSRPVKISLFQCSPFNLTEDQIALVLDNMKLEGSYSDIAQSTTSIGNIFAYSTDFLDHDHAVMLAEWFDVGQVENP
ncbi:MAG: hypothetical protein ABSG91_01635 [Syntrophobacteraceae bacterium]